MENGDLEKSAENGEKQSSTETTEVTNRPDRSAARHRLILSMRPNPQLLLAAKNLKHVQGPVCEPVHAPTPRKTEKPVKQKIISENLRGPEISEDLVDESADFYRYLFGRTMHHRVCIDCEKEGKPDTRLSYEQIREKKLGNNKQEPVSLEDMDNNGEFDCPCCKEPMQLVYDPDTIRANFKEKLLGSPDSFLSLFRRGNDGPIAGIAFAYLTTAERERELEWGKGEPDGNPYMAGAADVPISEESKRKFIRCLEEEIYPDEDIDENTELLGWNCVGTDNDLDRRAGILTRNLFDQVPPEHRSLPVLGDVKNGTRIQEFFHNLGGRDGTCYFKPGMVLIGGNVGVVQDSLNPRKKKEREKLAAEAREKLHQTTEGGSNPANWDALAGEYSDKVYSITGFPSKRDRLIEPVNSGDNILIAGCGSEAFLQQHLLSEKEAQVVASDFSQGMLDASRANFQHSELTHMRCDTRTLPFENKFDHVFSTNSIIPPNRKDVVSMYEAIHKSLKDGGQLSAYLPSFTLCEQMLEAMPSLKDKYGPLLDMDQHRMQDTVGWQCWHTEDLIKQELEQAGFDLSKVMIEQVGCEDEGEANILGKLYQLDPQIMQQAYWSFYVTAKK